MYVSHVCVYVCTCMYRYVYTYTYQVSLNIYLIYNALWYFSIFNFFKILITIPYQCPLTANNRITGSSSCTKYINNSLQYLLCKCFVIVHSVTVLGRCLKPLNHCVIFIGKMLQTGFFLVFNSFVFFQTNVLKSQK